MFLGNYLNESENNIDDVIDDMAMAEADPDSAEATEDAAKTITTRNGFTGGLYFNDTGSCTPNRFGYGNIKHVYKNR